MNLYRFSKANQRTCNALSVRLALSVLVCLVTPVYGDSTISVLTGTRDLDHSEDVLPSLSIYYQIDLNHFVIKPEASATLGFDPLYGGSEYDLSIGGVYQVENKAFNIDLGSGLSYFSSSYGVNEVDGTAYYMRAAITWNISNSHALGFDIRKLKEINSNATVVENSSKVGYLQTSLLWRIRW